jgi:hypothetical protein
LDFGFWILRMRELFGFPDSLAHQAGLKFALRTSLVRRAGLNESLVAESAILGSPQVEHLSKTEASLDS